MKRFFAHVIFIFLVTTFKGQEITSVCLIEPETEAGFSVMKTLHIRASAHDFDTTELSIQDLSNVLWAANGINRPESGKRTASSAVNAQDIDLYVFTRKGVYVYMAASHLLQPVLQGDQRKHIAGNQKEMMNAPVFCVLVSDVSRFTMGTDSVKMVWAGIDAGIVSQNISLYCASVGLATRPRSGMNQQMLRQILMLKPTQFLMLNMPVGYRKIEAGL